MRKNHIFIFIVISLITFACAGSKSVQRIDGPDDYYEAESSSPETSKTPDNTSTKTESKTEPEKTGSTQPARAPAAVNQTKQESSKSGKAANNQTPPPENTSTPVKIEENPVSPEVLEELGDDTWGKDENKTKIRSKDKDKIKDSSPDDDKWGKE